LARAPFIVFVYPYIKAGDNEFEYALLRSTERGVWEAVAGGGEGNETILEAAKRETYEETGILNHRFIQLDTVAPVPVTRFTDSYLWGDDVFVIPLHYFGVLAENKHILLSEEHIEFRWLKYHDAYNLLKFDDDKIALWELDRKLRGLGPRD